MKLKKPKFWDYKKPNLFAILLYPVAIIVEKIISLKKKTNKNNFKIEKILNHVLLKNIIKINMMNKDF